MQNTSPVPAQIKNLRSTYRLDRDFTKSAINPLNEVPPAPSGFSDEQINAWHSICEYLIEAGTLQEVGIPLLKSYFDYLAIYQKCIEDIRTKGIILPNGKTNLHNGVMKTVINIMIEIASQFGFTPLSQGKIKIVKTNGIPVDKDFGF